MARPYNSRASAEAARVLTSDPVVAKDKGKKSKTGLPPTVARPRVPFALLFRMFVIGSVAVVASIYGVYRYYFVPRTPMLAPTPSATEIPAPELEPSR